jgi:CobQ-like glutamine amidotransferase family enzyme
MYEINICHLYPDLLNLYGDRGNIITLSKRCEWRGISFNITNISCGDLFDHTRYDMIFIGGGQDYEQEILKKDLLEQKADEIKNAIENNKVILAICGGYQLLGKYYKTGDDNIIEFLGALDLWTIAGNDRLIGNLVFECDFLKSQSNDGRVVGFENHSGRTFLGEGIKPMGRVISGFGNNAQDGFEGAIYKNTYCSYSHGSLLPKNPVFADYLISLALKEKYDDFTALSPLDDQLEQLCHDTVIKQNN